MIDSLVRKRQENGSPVQRRNKYDFLLLFLIAHKVRYRPVQYVWISLTKIES